MTINRTPSHQSRSRHRMSDACGKSLRPTMRAALRPGIARNLPECRHHEGQNQPDHRANYEATFARRVRRYRLRGAAVESILVQPFAVCLRLPKTDSLVTLASSLLPEGVQS